MPAFTNGEELMLGFEFSVSKGIQRLHKNGSVLISGPRTSATNIGGTFSFPLIMDLSIFQNGQSEKC